MSNRLPYGNSLMVSTWIISFEKNWLHGQLL